MGRVWGWGWAEVGVGKGWTGFGVGWGAEDWVGWGWVRYRSDDLWILILMVPSLLASLEIRAPIFTIASSVAAPRAAAPSVIASSDAATSDDAVDDIDVGPAGSDFLEEEVEASDYSTEDSVESEGELVGHGDEEKYSGDVHKEVRELRAKKRKFQRKKKSKRVPIDNAEVPVGEARPDLGFDETETSRVSHEGRLGGDDPYFTSSDEDSFVLDEDDCCGDDEHEVVDSGRARTVKLSKKRTTNQKIIHDPTAKEVVWQLGIVFKDVSEFRRAVTKYATTVRRERFKVLKEIMGDYVVEFGRILDYKDELLRTNSGTSCVVKLGELMKQKMKLLGPEKMMQDLMYYNINYWCKVYFNTEVKYDSVDNNMSECFNAWILAARHKTIISMLEEIRVKIMTRISTLREFPNTWCSNYSLMCLKILEENINRAMDCTIKFNRVAGFEVKKGLCQHTVDIFKRTCSCRLWQLKGILCVYGVAALLFKKHPLYGYIDSCYSKETYLRTYANVIEPLANMEMWHVSSNITIAPPEISTLPGRPSKSRKKEARETKKSKKLPRTRLSMTCILCHVRGYNKKRCPLRGQPAKLSVAPSVTPIGSCIERGRPKKTTPETPNETPQVSVGSGRGRGRPKPGMPSSKICSTGQARIPRLADITGNIGYTPSTNKKPAKVTNPMVESSTVNGGSTVQECQDMIRRSLRTPIVKFLKEHLEKSGCRIGDNFIKAIHCDKKVSGGYVRGHGVINHNFISLYCSKPNKV
ncbi:putative C2 and GRAM domain-containing protein-like [Capsicum annuum]|nr:putative C2 and GRAM domain-containing protein-like [Capsicum annuum]